MEIAFHCPNCLADLIYDESKSYTCCFCHTVFTGKHEVRELEGGYYVGDAWNEKVYHTFHCEECGSDFIAKPATAGTGCPICSSHSVKDNGGMVGAMPRRAIPFAHTKQQAQEMFLDYIRNNSAVGRTLATDENKELLHKVYVPIFLFTYEVVAHAKLTAMLRNKATEGKTLFGINGTEGIAEQLSALRSSFSRFQANRKGAAKEASDQPSEHVTGGVLSWQGIPFDASGILPSNVMNMVQPYDQSKMVLLNEKVLLDTPVLAITKDPVTCMQDFMERIKKWTRQMIMDAHSDSYDISYFQDRTDYPLGIGELVLFPIWYMKGEYMGREFYFAMNGQNGQVEANIPMSKGTAKNAGITYQQYWDKSRCTALTDTHFEFNIHDPNIEILDYSFFEKPKDSLVTPEGRKKPPERSDLGGFGGFTTSEPKKTETEKKPYSAMDVEMPSLRKRDPNKKMTKEEELQHEREVTARLRVAAKEDPKGDMAAAASVPSWAKAVTPPPSATSAAARPARTKKPAMDRPSAAASANKPLWEKTEEERASEGVKGKPMSLADRMAKGEQEEELKLDSPFTMKMPPIAGFREEHKAQEEQHSPELEDTDLGLSGILAEAQAQADAFAAETGNVEKEETPEAREIGAGRREQVFREQFAATPESDVKAEDAYEIPMPKIQRPKKKVEEPKVEEPAPVEEPKDGGEMVANITFSFNKKKAPFSGEEKPASPTSIPRQPEKEPELAQGMAIMNSEYDSGVLRHTEVEHLSEEEGEVREILPKSSDLASENYVGSDENDRPLKYRPAAPLAQKRGDVYVEEIDPHPELDENNRPLATRPPAPLARAEGGMGPTLEYLTEHELDDNVRQMHSMESGMGGRWGEMPEATETPSWAKPQEEERPAGRPARRPTAGRPGTSGAAGRPGMGRPAGRPGSESSEERAENMRPGMGAGRPGAAPARPAPAWARDQEADRPAPAWARPQQEEVYEEEQYAEDQYTEEYAGEGYVEEGYADGGYDARYEGEGYADDGYSEAGYADDGYADEGYADDGYADEEERAPREEIERPIPTWARPEEEEAPSPFKPRPQAQEPSNLRSRGRAFMSREDMRAAGEEAARRASAAPRSGGRVRSLEEKKAADAASDNRPAPQPFQRGHAGPRILNSETAARNAERAPQMRPATGPRTLESTAATRGERRVRPDAPSSSVGTTENTRPAPRPPVRQDMARPGEGAGRPGSASARPGMGAARSEEAPRPGMGAGRPGMGRPAGRPGSEMADDRAEERTENTRPGMGTGRPGTGRPGMGAGRPGTGRPGAGRPAAEPKQVPIWERKPDTDAPLTPWGTPAGFSDDRPRGSLMKPKDQVIDVEKPRERPTLWRPDGEAKEILPGAVKDEDRDPREVGGGAREVVVRPDRIPPRPPPRASQRASSGVNVEIGGSAPRREPKIPEGLRDIPEETEDRPVDRPRTFAQRRQMEEERANRERNGLDPESTDPFKPEE